MNNIQRVGYVEIDLPRDERGYFERVCPSAECGKAFSTRPETLTKNAQGTTCPYCGKKCESSAFHSLVQKAYARGRKEEARERARNDIRDNLRISKTREGIKFSVQAPIHIRVLPNQTFPNRDFETEAKCSFCGLEYLVYGVHGFCPGCGQHNSLDILYHNLDIVCKKLNRSAGEADSEMQHKDVVGCLHDAVADFDAFGRATVLVHAENAGCHQRDVRISFQDIAGARERVREMFGIDFASSLGEDDWRHTARLFQKRHLFAHRAGVVDEEYRQRSGDKEAMVGRKIALTAEEVKKLVEHLKVCGKQLYGELAHARAR
jgi:hypothetical protein